jgi:hypothetical protein
MFNHLKQVIVKLYIVGLMGFTVWYGFFLYPVIYSHDEHEPETESVFGTTLKKPEAMTQEETAFRKFIKEQKATATTDLGYTVVKEQYVKGHFHHIGMTVESDETNVCVRCHGAIPHDKSKAIRGFLNMHAFYLACETCHIRGKPEQGPWTFRWYDKKDGHIVENPPGLVATEKEKFGNYGTKVAPGTLSADGSFRFINGEKERAFVVNYMKNKDEISSTEQSKMKKVIHRMVNEKPLLCDGCHTDKSPYLPFVELGYPPRRIAELKSTAVVGLINKYREFYIPKFLLPGQGWDEKRRAPKSP